MQKITRMFQLVQNMGIRYVAYRVLNVARVKTGWHKRKFPVAPDAIQFLTLEEWKKEKKAFFFRDSSDIPVFEADRKAIAEKAIQIRNGSFLFFNSILYELGSNYDWVTNPQNGYRYPVNKHWSDINDFSEETGDIKFVWEKSRFGFIYDLIRDEQANGTNHQQFIYDEILDWIDHNPVNCGPNWKCSQEISLRVLNWIFALYYYSNRSVLSETDWQKIGNSIYWQIRHVYDNILFSRIAVRNNHAITETLALYLVGMLFPSFRDADRWKKNGKKWFQEEITYQIYEDGTFLQFSMNYHRVVIQLLSWAIVISANNKESLSEIVIDRAYRSLTFLFSCQNEKDGWLPNYGANDGALFFQLNNCHYRDFRPQLGALHYILTGKDLYDGGLYNEDRIWLAALFKPLTGYKSLQHTIGIKEFAIGGYYLIREKDSLTFMRCGNHKDRPSQADNLHLDIWHKSENVFFDAGSYKYNDPDKKLVSYFVGTNSHNTVMLNNADQMLKGGRFIWYYWTQAEKVIAYETEDMFCIDGTISAFRQLDKSCKHRRVICKLKGKAEWIVEDHIYSNREMKLRQLWHTKTYPDHNIMLQAENSTGQIALQQTEGWSSELYGARKKTAELFFDTETPYIRTTITVKE